MSTNINITVGDNALLDAAKQQQGANRQAQLQKEATLRLESQAISARTTALAAQGRDANGNLITGVPFTQPQIDRRPAANRVGNIFRTFYFPNQPDFDITLTSVGAINPTLIGFMDADGPLFRGRSRTALTHNLYAGFITHTPSLIFEEAEGPFLQSCITHYSPPVPPFSPAAAARFLWGNVSFDQLKPFTGLTLEADFANGDDTSDLEHNLFWSDPVTGYNWSANYRLNRLGGTLVFGLINDLGSLVNFTGTFPPDQLMKVDLTHWHRYGLCITQTTAFFAVDGVELARVNYGSLNSVFTASASSMTLESITDSCRLSAVGFAPKALYLGSYTPKTLLR